jgi:DNA-binding MarR family transcriptional regulator
MKSVIQRKLQKKKPFSSDNQEAIMGILLAAEKLRQQMDAAMSNWDITLQQYNVLRILRGTNEAGLPIMKIADRMIEKTPGITRMIDRMVKQKKVKRERSIEDRRKILVTITPIGLQLLQDMQGAIDQYDEDCFSQFTEAECKQLIRGLNRFLQ